MTSTRLGGMIGMLMLAGFGTASAQQSVSVQLPQFRYFTVNTTVSAPDSGRGLLGGVNRVSSARGVRGAPYFGKTPGAGRLSRHAGIAGDVSSSGAEVLAKIIDLHEMDEETLGKVAEADPTAHSVLTERKAGFISRHVGTASVVIIRTAEEPAAESTNLPSVANIRRDNEAALQRREAEAAAYLEKGKSLEAEGKAGVAKIYYSMAARQAGGEVRAEAAIRLETLRSGR